MKAFTRAAALACGLLLCVSLAACGNQQTVPAADSAPGGTAQPAADSAAPASPAPEKEELSLPTEGAPLVAADVDGTEGDSSSQAPASAPAQPGSSAQQTGSTPSKAGSSTPSSGSQTGSGGSGSKTEETAKPGQTEQPSAGETEPPAVSGITALEEFEALSPAEKDAFMESFDSIEDFTAWLVQAQAEYAANHPTEEIGADGVIQIGH